MVSLDLVPPLLAFAGMLLAAALLALSASGHFPRHDRPDGGPGAVLLWASILIGFAATVSGVAAGWRILPWPSAVIAGGLAVLAAPLVLQQLPDRFVDGPGALAAFSAGTLVLALTLVFLTG